jgi:hypothetical protein
MSSVNNINLSIDQTAQVFNAFDQTAITINSNEYTVVNGFFKSIVKSVFDADRITETFFAVSQSTGVPVLTLLQEIEGQTELQVTATLSSYLNTVRSPSTLIGVNAPVIPNFYVARNVLP